MASSTRATRATEPEAGLPERGSQFGLPASVGVERTRILGVFAHPDDETFCCGGVFARQAELGAEIMVVSATRGQAGQIRDASVASRRTIAAVREGELRLACQRLGVTSVRCLDYVDGTLADLALDQLVDDVAQIIEEYRPQLVFSFGAQGGYGHPDHIAISRTTTLACQRLWGMGRGRRLSARPPLEARLYHSFFPPGNVLLMEELATWLTSRRQHFAGTLAFAQALLVMAEEAGTMHFIRDHAQVCWYPPGAYVVEQGEASTQLFLILSGHAEVWQDGADGERRLLNRLSSGEFFGELGLAGDRPRSANVVAAEGLTCLVLSSAPPTKFAGRGAGARLSGPGPDRWSSPPPAPAAEAGASAIECDVRAQIGAKIDALCAYRSQFALQPGMFPDFMLEEILGKEHFLEAGKPPGPPGT